jgi:hypothetical protein
MGNRDPTTTTPVLYLPTVAGSLSARSCSALLVTRTGAHRSLASAFSHGSQSSPCSSKGCTPPASCRHPYARQPFGPSFWAFTRSGALQRARCGCCSGDDCSRLRFSRHQKAPPGAAGYIEYRPPEWRSAGPGALSPWIEPPWIESCGSRPHLPRHSNGMTLIPGCGRPRLRALDVWT